MTARNFFILHKNRGHRPRLQKINSRFAQATTWNFSWDLPKLFGCDAGAFGYGLQLGPHDGGMNAAVELFLRKAAIGSGNDVLSPDAFRKPDDALRDQFRMFDNVCAVTDDTGNKNL